MYDQCIRMLLCSAAGLISIFLPWIKYGYNDTKDVSSGLTFPYFLGIICFLLFLLILILSSLGDRTKKVSRNISMAVVALSIVTILISLYSLWSVENHAFTSSYSGYIGKAGLGLYFAAGASALLIFFALVDFDTKRVPDFKGLSQRVRAESKEKEDI